MFAELITPGTNGLVKPEGNCVGGYHPIPEPPPPFCSVGRLVIAYGVL